MTTEGSSPLMDHLREVEANAKVHRAAERAVFEPSPVIEHLLWQVCGAWETIVEQVRFFRYVVAETTPTEAPFVEPDGARLPRHLRRIACDLNLRLPSRSEWTAECKAAKSMRDDLGHMLHFKSIEGTTPDQVVALLRVPYREPDEMTTSDDGHWATHNRKTVVITEQDARAVLAGLKYVNDSIFALRKFGMEFAVRPDDMSTGDVLPILPWWLDDWGPKPGEPDWNPPTMGQLRLRPKAEYDASLPPERRPEF